MNWKASSRRGRPFALAGFAAALGCWLLTICASAFPPAPDHTIFGLVRDESGNPLAVDGAQIILETSAGLQVKGVIVPGLEPGINYKLIVPMDSGLTADAYKPTALRPTAPFRLKVIIGNVTYLPIEMKGDYAHLGQPAGQTRIDLTLGEDSDNDGLPDAWERQLIAALGGGLTLADIRPGDDADHDGLSNLAEYIAGTYAFDPSDGFRLDIANASSGAPLLEFLAINRRTYTLYGSSDLKTWNQLQFIIPAEGPSAINHDGYVATDVRVLQVQPVAGSGPAPQFFKMLVQ